MKVSMDSLASTRAGQPPLRRKCSMVPRVGVMMLQRGQMPSMLDKSQYLVRDSTLALPDKYLAWMTAFLTSYGEEPHVVKRGCVLERDMKLGSKYLREPSFKNAASVRYFLSQKSRTADFTSFLNGSFFGGEFRNVIGWGRRYFNEIF